MKKITALFLAMLMCMALAVPALANQQQQQQTPNRKTTYTVGMESPVIDVTVPTASKIRLNPYQIKVNMSTASGGDFNATNAQGSILSAVMYLTNKSNVPLKMSISAVGGIPNGSKATFNTTPPTAEEKNKKIFMYVEVGALTEAATPAVGTLSTPTAYSATNTKQGVIKAGELKMTNVLDITPPTRTPSNQNGDTASSNYVPIMIGGSCAKSPTEAWGSSDTVTLDLTFSFQAAENSTGNQQGS